MKPVLNIRFIGQSITEFMVQESFEKTFKQNIKAFGSFIAVVNDFDPRSARDSTDKELEAYARTRFAAACHKIINSETTSEQVKTFFEAYAQSNEHVKKAYQTLVKGKSPLVQATEIVETRKDAQDSVMIDYHDTPYPLTTRNTLMTVLEKSQDITRTVTSCS